MTTINKEKQISLINNDDFMKPIYNSNEINKGFDILRRMKLPPPGKS